MKNTVYVPIRALGDFTITTAIIKNNFTQKVNVILPKYLQSLFEMLNASEYYEVIDVIDMETSPVYFELHKIKSIKGWLKFIKEVIQINQHTNHRDNYLFDYRNRRLNIARKKFYWPNPQSNIYDGKTEMLKKFIGGYNPTVVRTYTVPKNPKVVFFPGSRKAVKILTKEVIEGVLASNVFSDLTIAYHQSEDAIVDAIKFTNFAELKKIILDSDFIVGADSLPLHFAYYFNKPHFGIYNFVNDEWLTPYMIENNSFQIVQSNNYAPLVEKLKTIIDNAQ